MAVAATPLARRAVGRYRSAAHRHRRRSGQPGSFADTVVALEGATFSIPERILGPLVGPSGCGKSTLLRLVAGLIPLSQDA